MILATEFLMILEKSFRKIHNLGICEQSLIGFASGLALEGFKPWVYTITLFN